MKKDRNRPSSQSEHSFEHPFHHGCDSYSVFLRGFFFYLSNPSHPVYVWSAKTMLKSLRTTFENVSESWNVAGLSASFCVDGIGFSLRDRPDTISPGIVADYVTEPVCASNDQRWMQTTSGVAHDLPQGSGFYRVSFPAGDGPNTTLSQRCSIRNNTNIHFCLVKNGDLWNWSDGDETSILPLEKNEIHRAPFPSTVSGTFGLLEGKGMHVISVEKLNQVGRGVIPCS
jgi:hypothetical protein